MTLQDVQRIFAHWRSFPPLRILVAGFVGFKPEGVDEPITSNHMTAEEALEFARVTQGGKAFGIGRV